MNSPLCRSVLLLALLAGSARADRPGSEAPAALPLEAYADVGFLFGDSGKFGKLGWTEVQFDIVLAPADA